MSKGHTKGDMEHPRGNITHAKPGKYKGSKFVKKAGMNIEYENYNTPNKTDKQEWK